MPRSTVVRAISLGALLGCCLVLHRTAAAPLPAARSDREAILDLMDRCDRAARKKDWKTLFASTTEDWVREAVTEAEVATGLIYVFASIELEGNDTPDPATVRRKADATAVLEYVAGKRSGQTDAAAYKRRVEATADRSLTPGRRRELRLALSRDCYRTEDVQDLCIRMIGYLLGQAKKIEDPPVQKLLHLRVAGDRATGRFEVGGKTNTYEFRQVGGAWCIDEGPKEEAFLERGLSTPPLGVEEREP